MESRPGRLPRSARARKPMARSLLTTSSSRNRSPNCPRTASSPSCAARRKKCCRSTWRQTPKNSRRGSARSTKAASRRGSRSPTVVGPPTGGFSTPSSGRGRRSSPSRSVSTLGCVCGSRPKRTPSTSSPPTSRIYSSQLPPAPDPPWDSTPDSAPERRLPSSTEPAKLLPTRRFTRTSRRTSGTRLSRRLPDWSPNTASN